MKLIDADVFKEVLKGLIDSANDFNRSDDAKCFKDVLKLLDIVDTVEAVPIVHGRWVNNDIDPEAWNFCSVLWRKDGRGRKHETL